MFINLNCIVMNLKTIIFLFALLFTSNFIGAQTITDTTGITIELKDGSIYRGLFISENADSVKIKMKDFGIISISKNEIVYDNMVSIETTDGNEFLGEIVKENDELIVLKTKDFGEISIFKNKIKSKVNVESQQIKEGKLWFGNPQSTRYFWAPNGYGLKKGEGYYQNIWVLWNQVSYGITDNFSVGGGIIPLFLFAGSPTPVFATAKFSIPVVKNKVNLAGGAIVGAVLGEYETGFGLLYGLSTFGTPDNNVSLGLGYGFSGEDGWASSPTINLSGMFRLGSRAYFLTENYFFSFEDDPFFITSVGGRWIIKKAALDFGLFLPLNAGEFIAFPWLGFTIPFGKAN